MKRFRMIDILSRHYPWFLNIQMIHLLFPLLSFPYLLRIVGPEHFGVIAAAGSLTAILSVIAEYGISFTGVRNIARFAGASDQISRYLSEVLFSRLFIVAGLWAVMLPLILLVDPFKDEAGLYLLSISSIAPALLFSQWIYSGLRSIRFYTVLTLAFKSMQVILIFLVITTSADYRLYPLTVLLPAVLSAGISLAFLSRNGMSVHRISFEHVLRCLRRDLYPFLSQGITQIYTQSNPLILLFLIQDTVLVGYYALAEKIVNLARSTVTPLNHAVQPIISGIFAESVRQGFRDIARFALLAGSAAAVVIGMLEIFAETIVTMIGGSEYLPSVPVVRILAPIILLIVLNQLAGVQILLNLDLQKEFFSSIALGVLMYLLTAGVLIPQLSYRGPAVSWVLSELTVLTVMLFYVIRYYRRYVHD